MNLHQLILEQGFEETLQGLIDYAEAQARLTQSLGDAEAYRHWVRSWANLQSAADRIAIPIETDEAIKMWHQYIGVR